MFQWLRFPTAIIKVTLVLSFIGVFLVLSLSLGVIIKDPWRLTKSRDFLISRFCRLGLRILGIKSYWKHLDRVDPGNHLFVSNHLSYTDILVLASQIPSSFVTSVEIKNTPGLGQIVKAAGCLFVERRNKDNLANEVKEITEALKNDINVTIFPEATSTNGESVLRFRRPLYEAAIQSQKAVQPLCINYTRLDNEKVTVLNRDSVCWYGDMDFLPHLWNLALYRRIEVTVSVLNSISMQPQINIDQLATSSHQQVNAAFRPLTVETLSQL